MSFAINMLALLLVLGMCWFAMVWLTGRPNGRGFHRHGLHGHGLDQHGDEAEEDLHYVAMPVTEPEPGAPCMACEGVGATHNDGTIKPCSACLGTGQFAD